MKYEKTKKFQNKQTGCKNFFVFNLFTRKLKSNPYPLLGCFKLLKKGKTQQNFTQKVIME